MQRASLLHQALVLLEVLFPRTKLLLLRSHLVSAPRVLAPLGGWNRHRLQMVATVVIRPRGGRLLGRSGESALPLFLFLVLPDEFAEDVVGRGMLIVACRVLLVIVVGVLRDQGAAEKFDLLLLINVL